jgi:hypothetical protein
MNGVLKFLKKIYFGLQTLKIMQII